MNRSQEVLTPGVFWYEAGLPENLPSFVGDDFNLGAPSLAASLPAADPCGWDAPMTKGCSTPFRPHRPPYATLRGGSM